ncbi:hypothetical protein EIP91_005189 [Steccherinum ochraceum]|uniref:GST N-terminal domain-containing protein n=1 Tax=Steccherinum ochraceum TaxID=92696 RepID=A0A4R0R7I3_9APHY|nr:hypothetical protein EIP91_005189 [Steccherinum ochraceum]
MSVLVLYDIPGKTEETKAWSPSTWKTRFALNYKGIPYRTEWVEYPDIEKVCKEIGAEPTDTNPDGTPLYTFPVIHDPSTNTVLSNSIPIALYLDKTYPDHPLYPPGTKGFHAAFQSTAAYQSPTLWNLIAHAACVNLTPRSEAYFKETFWRRKRSETDETPIEELAGAEGSEVKEENWRQLEENLVKMGEWYERSGEGPFLMGGDKPCYADMMIGARLMWARQTWGKDSRDWKRLEGIDGGRWGRFIKALEKYATVI